MAETNGVGDGLCDGHNIGIRTSESEVLLTTGTGSHTQERMRIESIGSRYAECGRCFHLTLTMRDACARTTNMIPCRDTAIND